MVLVTKIKQLYFRCDFGYYGNPRAPGGSCVPCNCDPHGSIHFGCDETGKCSCKPGITGIDCSMCAPRHIISENGCTCKLYTL